MMIELRNSEQELERFRLRLMAAVGLVIVGFGLLVARLIYLQVITHDELSMRAENNRISVVPIVPNRGLIFDRNGLMLAHNYSAYSLEITRSKLEAPLEEVLDSLAGLVTLDTRDRKRFKRLLEDARSFEPVPLRTQLSDEEVARVTAHRYRYPGVDVRARLYRRYPYGETGGHLLGYIARINQAEKKAMEDWEEEDFANYRGTDVMGKQGIEQFYEKELHGRTGVEEVETSAGGLPVRHLRSEPATPGHSLHLSIDFKLQDLIERMYGNRRGALVAIDPRNGEILAFVSRPGYDPNLFVNGIDQDSWKDLNESIDKPLLNRALRGTYPPGSTYKPFMAMAALHSGKRTAGQVIMDNGSFTYGNHRFRSHGDHGLGAVDMVRSIIHSSNVYYYSLAAEMGVDLMHEEMEPYGFGRRVGIDLRGEATGDLPSTSWKEQKYKRAAQRKWYPGETISLGIGQGYNNFTMLQLASAMATMVSGGKRFEPRLVRAVEDVVSGQRTPPSDNRLEPLDILPAHLDVIRRAMYGVTQSGTSTRVFAGAGYQSGGKTGTAQAKSVGKNEKYNAARLNEYFRDHALYTAFAPLQEPRIALAVIVENAGFGAESAAPIARRVLDYVLLGQYPSEADLELVKIGKASAPVGTPRRAIDVPLRTQGADTPLAANGAASSASATETAASTAPLFKPTSVPAAASAQRPPLPPPEVVWINARQAAQVSNLPTAQRAAAIGAGRGLLGYRPLPAQPLSPPAPSPRKARR